jgi:hypothetical protein
MNKIERALYDVLSEIERYEEAGIQEYHLVEFKRATLKAKAHYEDFKKKTGILNVVSKLSYIPNGW